MKNAKQKQEDIVGGGGKLINHGDTEITKRGKRKLETGNWKLENGKRIHAETRRRGDAGSAEGGRLTESRPLGKVEIDQPQVGPKGKISGSERVNRSAAE
jgi:hypothetical protein